uniref:bifunctional tRNA (5-methylaminomethyl-2-thiouridine)(34)-methyltransferase MnmD/FAD-dependent 5-carboxymethylaminomethyl-2-thiouridine(34) oxidoreductase MnmC n=1 Tax=Ningiella ruwaisensis TaxID=2364274 RepID=UPI00109F0321|nr:bifunctional tRNA (5-methylaminomethyl-2-thiouridine)(34)-methyltransferase MnmD/FAD-dependent 5-carboxymethylaminomethyl-2-thiouridine(34) oxidoreductase MnmC [Ningiella ruwaisensis]
MKLRPADIQFNGYNTPQSKEYGDVYYSNEDGIAESQYVFIDGNHLSERWASWQDASFCIAESGFGSGLNFLLTLKAFDAFRKNYPCSPLKRLHFISFEKHPLRLEDLKMIAEQRPELHQYSEALITNYPPALEGIHRSYYLQDAVVLDLAFGDINEMFTDINCYEHGLVDAWYLDGFAPSKNTDMWSQSAISQMAQFSRPDASLATFTAAGFVKRSLQAAGFEVTKIPGFGRKREMITARFRGEKAGLETASLLVQKASPAKTTKATPWFRREAPSQTPEHVAIAGAGLAGALLAYQFTNLGVNVSLICEDAGPAQGASGNPVGGFYPQLNAEAGINSQFFVHAFLYARRFYDDLLQKGLNFDHNWCGVLQLAFNENTQTRLNKMLDKSLWPDELAYGVDAREASAIANLQVDFDALFLPLAGWIAPASLVKALIDAASATGRLNCLYSTAVSDYQVINADAVGANQSDKTGVTVDLTNPEGENKAFSLHADALIFATGHSTPALLKQHIPMRMTRGQVEAIPATTESKKLSTVLCHKGYFTPAVNERHALGSTYIKNDLNTDYRASERSINISMHLNAMGNGVTKKDAVLKEGTANCESDSDIDRDREGKGKSNAPNAWFEQLLKKADAQRFAGRAAIRCSTPDHLPLMGALPNIDKQCEQYKDLYKALPAHNYPKAKNVEGVYILGALGSRGITSAPILADALVSQIMNRPLPLGIPLLNALSPNRFLMRALTRQTPYP